MPPPQAPPSTPLLKTFAAFNTLWLTLTAGISTSMSLFIIPIIRDHPTTSLIKTQQFHDMVDKGAKYLQSTARLHAVSLLTLIYLLYRHPEKYVSRRWRYFAAAFAVLVQVAWYEVVFVFPVNGRMAEIEGELGRTGEGEADERARGEVLMLLERWKWRHVGRMVLPLVAAGIEVAGLL